MADAIPHEEEEEEEESHIFPDLPDEDAGFQCLARLPRSCYRPLSRVCKLWQSQFRSQTLYSTRKALKVVDFSICLYTRIPENVEELSKWYEMFPGSNSTDGSLFKIPLPPQPVLRPSVVSLGAKIYVIGGVVGRDSTPTRTVWVYDLVSNQWKLVESQMAVARESPAVAVVNNKIYVTDCWHPPNWEVFDTETEAWSPLPNPDLDEVVWWDQVDTLTWWSCAVVDGKIIYSAVVLFDEKQVTLEFDPSSGEWRQLQAFLGWLLDSMTVVDGVFYRFIDGKIMGYDFDGNEWKEVLRGGVMDNDVLLLPEPIKVSRMVNMNGKLVILCEESCTVGTTEMLKFHAAVIEVSRKDDDPDAKFWGSILWMGIFGEAPLGTVILDCIAVGL